MASNDNASSNGAGSFEDLTPEQQAELQQLLEHQRAQHIQRTVELGLLALDEAGREKLSVEAATRMAAGVVDALPQLAQAIEDIANPEAVAANPYWGFRLLDRQGKVLGATIVPKRVTNAKGPEEVIQYLATMSFILSSVPHFVAGLLGLRIELVQTAQPPEAHRSKLIL